MRLGQAIFFGSAAALLTLAAPTLARNSSPSPSAHPVKSSEAPTSSSCHAYQQTADGTWTQLSCLETGSRTSSQSHPAAEGAAGEAQ